MKIKIFSLKENTSLILILIASFLTRMLPISKLYTPLFSDPAVEGTLARIIIENGLVPKTWGPFIPLELRHQFGFASIIALLSSFSSLPIAKTILLFTQLIHALFPFSIYFFVKYVTRNNLQALAASLVAVVAAFPTYIFIAGMNSGILAYFLLPILTSFSLDFLKKPKKGIGLLLFFFSLATYAIHSTSIFFLALILFPFLLIYLRRTEVKTVCLLAVFLGISFVPTFLYSFSLSLPERLKLIEEQWKIQAGYINPYKSVGWKEVVWSIIEPFFVFFNNNEGIWYLNINNLTQSFLVTHFINVVMITLFIFSFFEVIRKKSLEGYAAIALYFLFLAFSTYQAYFKLEFPGYQTVYPSRVKFFLILPISYLLSFGLTSARRMKMPNLILLILLSPLLLHSIYVYLLSIGSYSPVGKEEIEAFKLIEQNVPVNCTILNFVRRIEAGAFIGDAGEWILAYTGRRVVFPATSVTDDIWKLRERLKIMDLVEENKTSELLPILKKYGVCYVFVDERKSYFPLTYNIVDPRVFENDNHFELVYKNSFVHIFRIKY